MLGTIWQLLLRALWPLRAGGKPGPAVPIPVPMKCVPIRVPETVAG